MKICLNLVALGAEYLPKFRFEFPPLWLSGVCAALLLDLPWMVGF